jgi:hypothetical protein
MFHESDGNSTTSPKPRRRPVDGARLLEKPSASLVNLRKKVLTLRLTLSTYMSAISGRTGGTYLILWGPMLAGVVSVIGGLAKLVKLPLDIRAPSAYFR